jgi:hypothetical protein
MSPINYVESVIRDTKSPDSGIRISFTRSSSIADDDADEFTIGTGSQKRYVYVEGGSGLINIRTSTRVLIDQFHIDEGDGNVTLEDINTGQKLELVYKPPKPRLQY